MDAAPAGASPNAAASAATSATNFLRAAFSATQSATTAVANAAASAATSAASSAASGVAAAALSASTAFSSAAATASSALPQLPRHERGARERELRALGAGGPLCHKNFARRAPRAARQPRHSPGHPPLPCFIPPPPPAPPPPPPVHRARDLSQSADAVERGGLSREVEYAKTTSALYAVVLKEAQGVRATSLRCLRL